MKLMTVVLMASVLLTLPVSAQGMRGRHGGGAAAFTAGRGNCPRGQGTCDGTGPKRQGNRNCNGSCPRGAHGAAQK